MNGSSKKRILLVDNDADYRRSLLPLLELEGYEGVEADSVTDAKQKLQEGEFDLALLDLRMIKHEDDADISGLDVAKTAREAGTPVIVMTAFESVETAKLALRTRGGMPLAADYVLKKAGPPALLDAIKVVLAPMEQATPPATGDLQLDLQRGLVSLKGRPLRLSAQQYALLRYLYEKAGAVCSAHELVGAVYGEEAPLHKASADKRLERLVARLREKIEDDPSNPRLLLTVSGRGFRLNM